MKELYGWGRYPRFTTEVISPASAAALAEAQKDMHEYIARGNGRAYGDAAIGQATTLDVTGLNRMCGFNAESGLLTVEAGVLLSDIIDVFLPRGFFPPVVPGTKFVTVGGMIASDVHGKNHHSVGGFGQFVEEIFLAVGSSEIIACSPAVHAELFRATIGGMGLTGTIVAATIRLMPVETGWIRQNTVVAHDMGATIKALAEGEASTYSVAWIDCAAAGANLGRSLVYQGEHATCLEIDSAMHEPPHFPTRNQGKLFVPLDLPSFTLNRYSVRAFNELYFRLGARKAQSTFYLPADPYFFPLDGIGQWNRIYGRKGFLQHQCVIPTANAQAALGEIIGRIAARGNASFLAVLKTLSNGSGLMSFPMPGFTLALDFAVHDGIFAFLDEIDRIVVEAGGRIYLAKDARQSRETFEQGYPHLGQFREFRHGTGASGRFISKQSQRLGI